MRVLIREQIKKSHLSFIEVGIYCEIDHFRMITEPSSKIGSAVLGIVALILMVLNWNYSVNVPAVESRD